jgi:hypothetical protein
MNPARSASLLAQVHAEVLDRQSHQRPVDGSSLTITGTEVVATSPEGQTAAMPIEAFLTKVAARRMDTGGVVLPDGVKAVVAEGAITVWVYECPPSVQRFNWIAPDSPVPFGPGTEYRSVRLALPYVIVLVVFAADAGGNLHLTGCNECFFRTAPLKSLDDPLLYPALLNCSRFEPQEGKPLSWICTQQLRPTPAMRDPDLNKRMTASFEALRHCLLETGFNLSSEHHECSSWYTASRTVDPRIDTVEAWQAASAEQPLFVLEVPWLPTNHTLKQAAARICKQQQARAKAPRTAAALARVVFNHKPTPPATP